MEDTQNTAPGAATATKLGATRRGPDSQSVTKRYVAHPTLRESNQI